MTTFEDIELQLDAPGARPEALLACGEAVLENWIAARGEVPTADKREGFRLLALHRQGARGEPSFNACRETCRELAYHYNLLSGETEQERLTQQLTMMRFTARHLLLFVRGKLEQSGLGDFCCASRPLRVPADEARERGADTINKGEPHA